MSSSKTELILWDRETPTILENAPPDIDILVQLKNGLVICGDNVSGVHIYDLERKKIQHTIQIESILCAFQLKNGTVAICKDDGYVDILDQFTWKVKFTIDNGSCDFRFVQLRNGHLISFDRDFGYVNIWSSETGALLRYIDVGETIQYIVELKNGLILTCCASASNSIQIWH